MRESGLQRWVLSEIRGRGGYAVVSVPPVEAGTPDILACIGGRFLALELKTKGGVVSRIQSHRMNQIRVAGGVAEVVRSREELRELLSRL